MLAGISLDLSRLPGASGALAKLDTLKARFLGIPASVRANMQILSRVRALAGVEAYDRVSALQTEASGIDSGFSAAIAQFTHLDDLRRSGRAISVDTLTTAASLATTAESALRRSDNLTARTQELAAQYLSPSDLSSITRGSGASVLSPLFLGAAAVGLFLYARRRRGRA